MKAEDWTSPDAPIDEIAEDARDDRFTKERFDRVMIAYIEHWFWRRGKTPRRRG